MPETEQPLRPLSAHESRRAELEALKTELLRPSSQKSRPAKRLTYIEFKQRRRYQRVTLIGGLCFLVIGLLTGVYAGLTKKEPQVTDYQPPHPEIGTKEAVKIQAASVVRESRIPRAANSTFVKRAERNDALERRRFLDGLSVDGKMPRFQPLSALKVPPDKEAQIYCLLRSPLPADTEERWVAAGMLQHEAEVVSPYMRHVTIGSAESLNYLNDPVVESFALDLTPVAE
ncbi:MAG TPA: hypothetical protein VEK08_02710 [Planctomycetota bacterium]|nr:hypothetical protein [Planctomycetota bacterium]